MLFWVKDFNRNLVLGTIHFLGVDDHQFCSVGFAFNCCLITLKLFESNDLVFIENVYIDEVVEQHLRSRTKARMRHCCTGFFIFSPKFPGPFSS